MDEESHSSSFASKGRVFGHIEGIPVYTKFTSRKKLLESGVHTQLQAGIHGDPEEGAYSICLADGYEDDIDAGDHITYVGSGGRDDYGTQISNQSFDSTGNKALTVSCETKRPVRVTRGKNDKSFYSPAEGYRYDGLYVVDRAEMRRGKQGFRMCTFILRRIYEEGVGSIPNRRRLTDKRLKQIRKNAAK